MSGSVGGAVHDTRPSSSNRRARAWHRGLDPATAAVRCQGRTHHITWDRGRLVLVDHDLEAESALVALGGRAPACLDVIDACRRHLTDAGPLVLWSAEGDVLTAPGGSSLVAERRLDALRALPTPFRRRLALAALVAAARNRPAPGVVIARPDPSLAAVVTSLLVPALRRSLAAAGGEGLAASHLDVRWTAAAGDERPVATGEVGEGGGWARLRVPADWVATVWAHGRADVDGWLVLHPGDGRRLDDQGREGRGPCLAARWVPGRRGRLVLVTEVLDAAGPMAAGTEGWEGAPSVAGSLRSRGVRVGDPQPSR